jgi:hypothetical protein
VNKIPTTTELIRLLHINVATAVSFQRNGGLGDTWYCEACDIAYELEQRGHDVLDDWTVLLRDMPAPLRTRGFGHWELPTEWIA